MLPIVSLSTFDASVFLRSHKWHLHLGAFFTNVINSLQNIWFEEKEFIRCNLFIFIFIVWRKIKIFESGINLIKRRLFMFAFSM